MSPRTMVRQPCRPGGEDDRQSEPAVAYDGFPIPQRMGGSQRDDGEKYGRGAKHQYFTGVALRDRVNSRAQLGLGEQYSGSQLPEARVQKVERTYEIEIAQDDR